MPDSKNPNLQSWLKCIEQSGIKINEETIVVGHSLGCVTALQYLQRANIKIKAAIFVSGFINENPMEVQTEGLSEFVMPQLNLEKLKELIPLRITITAEDDDIVPAQATKKMAELLDTALIVLKNGKHFIDRDGCTKLPILLSEIKKLV